MFLNFQFSVTYMLQENLQNALFVSLTHKQKEHASLPCKPRKEEKHSWAFHVGLVVELPDDGEILHGNGRQSSARDEPLQQVVCH